MNKDLLKKPFLTNADIVELMQCSPSKASRIKTLIKKELEMRGRKIATNDIPTQLFIEIMNLDVNIIKVGREVE